MQKPFLLNVAYWQHKIMWRQVAAMVTIATVLSGAWHFGQLSSAFSAQAAYCSGDLVVTNFQLSNSSGVIKTQFNLNESIYANVTFKNQGSGGSTNATHTTNSRLYSNHPTTVAVSTPSDVNVSMLNGEWPAGWTKSYSSYPGGANGSVFNNAKSWSKSVAGNYVARIYFNFDQYACESNFANNQATINYTVGNPSNPTPTPVSPSPTPNPVPTATVNSKINLAIESFELANQYGVRKTTFAPNEAIFVRSTIRNTGTVDSPTGSSTQYYANRVSTVAVGAKDSPEISTTHGVFNPTSASNPFIYESWPGGSRVAQFKYAKSFSQSTPGTYVARVYADATNIMPESNEADNQRTLTYTIAAPITPTPTPASTPTPTPISGPYSNLVAESLNLIDSRGFSHPGNVFAPNEPIYPQFTIANRGTAQSTSGLQTHVYPNKPSVIPNGTASSPLSYVAHGIFSPNTAYSYTSTRLNGEKSFRQSSAGTYYARIFTDYANLDHESNESDNQRAVAYTVNNSWPKAVINPTNLLMVVNKKYKLSSDFVPSDLVTVGIPYTNNQPMRKEAATALKKMRDVMASQGVYMRLLSGYRSYWTQDSLYWSYVNQYGQAAADRFSARAGHSEHQSGWTADVGDMQNTYCDFDNTCFQNTKTGKWLINYAHNYGFIVRYLSTTESITGYYYEPWHIRYVGAATATAIRNSGKTVEEYYGITGGSY